MRILWTQIADDCRKLCLNGRVYLKIIYVIEFEFQTMIKHNSQSLLSTCNDTPFSLILFAWQGLSPHFID